MFHRFMMGSYFLILLAILVFGCHDETKRILKNVQREVVLSAGQIKWVHDTIKVLPYVHGSVRQKIPGRRRSSMFHISIRTTK